MEFILHFWVYLYKPYASYLWTNPSSITIYNILLFQEISFYKFCFKTTFLLYLDQFSFFFLPYWAKYHGYMRLIPFFFTINTLNLTCWTWLSRPKTKLAFLLFLYFCCLCCLFWPHNVLKVVYYIISSLIFNPMPTFRPYSSNS
jgi:hypothetical protein